MSDHKINPNVGRIVVQPDPSTNELDGFIMPEKYSGWGTVLAVGPPMNDMYAPFEMTKWLTSGVNPSPFKIGDKVLMPTVGGRDADEVKVFWAHDIPCWKKAE